MHLQGHSHCLEHVSPTHCSLQLSLSGDMESQGGIWTLFLARSCVVWCDAWGLALSFEVQCHTMFDAQSNTAKKKYLFLLLNSTTATVILFSSHSFTRNRLTQPVCCMVNRFSSGSSSSSSLSSSLSSSSLCVLVMLCIFMILMKFGCPPRACVPETM